MTTRSMLYETNENREKNENENKIEKKRGNQLQQDSKYAEGNPLIKFPGT